MLEICANSVESALAAQKGGAQRIELCSELGVGGVTPSYGLISVVKEQLSIPINVLIRPRGGDFYYDEWERDEIMRDIRLCGGIGINGIVIGALTKLGRVNIPLCRKWCNYAHQLGMSVTFHRAIDRTVNIIQAMECAISIGCDRILTSGGYQTAYEGKNIIKKMIDLSDGRIIIMPGSGVNSSNIAELASYTGATEFHMSAGRVRPSEMLKFGGIGKEELIARSDESVIRQVINIMNKQ